MIGRISFELNGVSHTLHFGMLSAQIFAEKGVKEVLIQQDGDENKDVKEASASKTLATIIHAGACNYAEIAEIKYPTFAESYDLMEQICLTGLDLQNDIFKCWNESRPTIDMLDRLKKPATEGEEIEKKSLKKRNGTRLKPTPTV